MSGAQPSPADGRPELVILMGIQATGKTSFYRARYQDSHVRISLDLLRTRNREARFLATCLETRMDAVVDNTNPTCEDRARYIVPAKSAGFELSGYFLESRVADALARNALREGAARIPDAGVLGCAKLLELPGRDEGFDHLFHVSMRSAGGFLIQEWVDGL